MSSMLSVQAKEFNVVIHKPKNLSALQFDKRIRNNVIDKFRQQGIIYFYIVHDSDINDDNVLKPLHYHFVLVCPKRVRVSTLLYRLCDYFDYGDNFIDYISIDKCISINLAVQYLTHKNDSDKFQYNYNYIITNSSELLKTYYNEDTKDDISTELLIKYIVYDNMPNIELMYKLGVSRYRYYKDIIYEIRSVYFKADDKMRVFLRNLEDTYTKK